MKFEATREGFGRGLLQAGKKDASVVATSGDLNDSTHVDEFRNAFPERFVQAGISEQNMVAMAAGLSMTGKVVFATSFGAFLPPRCLDQIRVSIALNNANVKLVATHCGVSTGEDGANAQMLEDIAVMRALPNFTVIVPCDAVEARKATLAAAREKGPFYLRLGREKTQVVTSERDAFRAGKANVLREGSDVAIVACGIEVPFALQVAQKLKKQIDCKVINLHTIKPIDEKAIEKAAKECGCIVTAEEHQIMGGMGSAVAEVVARKRPVPIEFVGVKDCFGESGNAKELLEKYGLTQKFIEKAVRKAMERKREK